MLAFFVNLHYNRVVTKRRNTGLGRVQIGRTTKGFIYGAFVCLFIFIIVTVYNNIFIAERKDLRVAPGVVAHEILDIIRDDSIVEQSFLATDDGFAGVALMFNTMNMPVDSEIMVGIREEGHHKDFIAWTTTAFRIESNEFFFFDFKPLEGTRGTRYVVSIHYRGVDPTRTLMPMFTSNPNEYLDGVLTVDGEVIEGTLAFRQLYGVPNAREIFDRAIWIYIFVLLFLLFIVWKFRDNLARTFFPVAMIIGLVFMFSTPMFRGQDETLHFFRAYEVSMGHAISDFSDGVGGRLMPSSLMEITLPHVNEIGYEEQAHAFTVPLNPEQVRFINFPNSALYSPVVYAPQAFGIWLARSFGLGPMYMAYFGRFFNLLVWALLMSLAMQILFFGKRMVFLLSLMPMTMYTVATLSADNVTNALSFLYIAYVLYLTFGRERRISRIQVAFLLALCVGISLSKIVYMPLVLICFMIPFRKLGGKRRYFKVMGSIVAISVIVNLIWLAISARFLITNLMPGVNATMQINEVLVNPFRFVGVTLLTISQYLNFYVQSFFGGSLGWFDIPVHTWIMLVYTVMAIGLAVVDNKYDVFFGRKRKLIMLAVVLVITALIHASIYVQYNRVGNPIIEGIQGRYFMPISLLMFYLLNNRWVNIEIPEKAFNFYVASLVVLLQLPVWITVMMHHL